MPRKYVVTFEKVSVSAVQDLIAIYGASGKMTRILEVALSDVDGTAPTNTQLALRCRYLPATVSAGSGGTTGITPSKTDPGDAAASITAGTNNTTKATTGGTAVVLREDGCNVFQGYTYAFPAPPVIGPSEAFVFEIITAPGSALTMSGTVTVEEMGG